jgi:hypothetical protein
MSRSGPLDAPGEGKTAPMMVACSLPVSTAMRRALATILVGWFLDLHLSAEQHLSGTMRNNLRWRERRVRLGMNAGLDDSGVVFRREG